MRAEYQCGQCGARWTEGGAFAHDCVKSDVRAQLEAMGDRFEAAVVAIERESAARADAYEQVDLRAAMAALAGCLHKNLFKGQCLACGAHEVAEGNGRWLHPCLIADALVAWKAMNEP